MIPENAMTVIEITNLSKTYAHNQTPALSNISFKIFARQKVGLIGANGSGKTTLFRLLLNMLHPDSGTISIEQETDLEKVKNRLGFVAEHQEGLENFTPDEILTYSGKMSGMTNKQINARKKDLLAWAKLETYQNDLIAGFSKGMRQRLFLSLALINQPPLLLLDEPMSGLDPDSQQDFRSLLHKLEGLTILYASHQLDEVEDLCERVIIFGKGEIIRDLNMAEIEKDIFTIESSVGIQSILQQFPDITLLQVIDGRQNYTIEISASQARIQDFFSRCQDQRIPILRFKSKSGLEDLYQKYVQSRS